LLLATNQIYSLTLSKFFDAPSMVRFVVVSPRSGKKLLRFFLLCIFNIFITSKTCQRHSGFLWKATRFVNIYWGS